MTALLRRPVCLLVASLFLQGAFAADGPGAGPGMPPAGAAGPWDADVVVYRALTSGEVRKTAAFERAGVPTVARMKDGRLIAAHQHFPENDRANFDKVAVHFSADEGQTWTAAQVLQLEGLPEGMRYPFDPTLVPLPDGKIRLYFTSVALRRDQASLPGIHSAVSTNGVDYTYEPGIRFSIPGRSVIDCAVVLHNGTFHLYSPDNGAQDIQNPPRNGPLEMTPQEGVGYHATSKDGLNFTRMADVKLDGRRRWLGNAQSDGKMMTFFGTGQPQNFKPEPGRPGGNLWMATSTDGQNWQLTDSPLMMGADPGAVRTKDGGLIIVTTGEPRAGTPSANRRPAMNAVPNNRPPDSPLLLALDANRDGSIDASELAGAGSALRSLDRNGDGRLSREEYGPPPNRNNPPPINRP